MRALSLHQLTVMEVEPIELFRIAAELKCEHVCLFTQELPPELLSRPGADTQLAKHFPLVKRKDIKELRQVINDTGVTAYNLEGFILTPETDVNTFRNGLELGAELGAQRATAISLDTDNARCVQTFGDFCELCGEYSIATGLEFCAFFSVKTLDEAIAVVTAAAHANGSIAVDVLHLIRNGSTPADLLRLDPTLIGYLQLCDGKLQVPLSEQWAEAIDNRSPPGEGEFPLKEFLAALPGRPLSLECPLNRLRDEGMDARRRARIVVESARKVIRETEPHVVQ